MTINMPMWAMVLMILMTVFSFIMVLHLRIRVKYLEESEDSVLKMLVSFLEFIKEHGEGGKIRIIRTKYRAKEEEDDE